MSAPAYAIFLDKDGEYLAYGFCNIGWFYTDEGLQRCFREAIKDATAMNDKKERHNLFQGKEFSWDDDWVNKWTHVKLYGTTYTRNEVTEAAVGYK